MLRRPVFLGLLLCCPFLAPGIFAASWAKPATLDTAAVHKVYLDGDFDAAIELLDESLQQGGPFSHEDSVFIFKHLGVMYTAKYETREKGKHYMIQLLNVEPTAKILDMYASDMIYMIFKNIQDEYMASRGGRVAKGARLDSRNDEPPRDQKSPSKERHLAWVGWTAGAVAIAGGVALSLYLVGDPEPSQKEHVSQ